MGSLQILSSREDLKVSLQQRQHVPLWLRVTVVVAVLIGIYFRFANLDTKMRWFDETESTLEVAGVNNDTLKIRGKLLHPSDLSRYLQIQPNTNVVSTVQVIADSKPHYAPLYFVLARLWAEITGTGVTAMRALTATISVLCLPAAYWCAFELLEAPVAALAFMALVSVAPLHVVFAQEINRYSLWVFTIFISSALLLRAMKEPTGSRWSAYTLAMMASLYTNLSSALIVLSHAAFVFISHPQTAGGRRSKFSLSMLVCTLTMIPWLVIVVAHGKSVMAMNDILTTPHSTGELFREQFRNATLAFFDGLNIVSAQGILAGGVAVFVEALSLSIMCRSLQFKKAVFCLTLIGGTLLPIFLSDLFLGGAKTCFARYTFPWIIGLELSVAFALAIHFDAQSAIKRYAARLVFVILLAGGVISCFVYSQSPSWWNKNDAELAASDKLNSGRTPLWVGSLKLEAITISQRLSPNVRLFILNHQRMDRIIPQQGYDPILIFAPPHKRSKVLRALLNGEPLQRTYTFYYF